MKGQIKKAECPVCQGNGRRFYKKYPRGIKCKYCLGKGSVKISRIPKNISIKIIDNECI